MLFHYDWISIPLVYTQVSNFYQHSRNVLITCFPKFKLIKSIFPLPSKKYSYLLSAQFYFQQNHKGKTTNLISNVDRPNFKRSLIGYYKKKPWATIVPWYLFTGGYSSSVFLLCFLLDRTPIFIEIHKRKLWAQP